MKPTDKQLDAFVKQALAADGLTSGSVPGFCVLPTLPQGPRFIVGEPQTFLFEVSTNSLEDFENFSDLFDYHKGDGSYGFVRTSARKMIEDALTNPIMTPTWNYSLITRNLPPVIGTALPLWLNMNHAVQDIPRHIPRTFTHGLNHGEVLFSHSGSQATYIISAASKVISQGPTTQIVIGSEVWRTTHHTPEISVISVDEASSFLAPPR